MLQVITITGTGDHHRLDQTTAITGIRNNRQGAAEQPERQVVHPHPMLLPNDVQGGDKDVLGEQRHDGRPRRTEDAAWLKPPRDDHSCRRSPLPVPAAWARWEAAPATGIGSPPVSS